MMSTYFYAFEIKFHFKSQTSMWENKSEIRELFSTKKACELTKKMEMNDP